MERRAQTSIAVREHLMRLGAQMNAFRIIVTAMILVAALAQWWFVPAPTWAGNLLRLSIFLYGGWMIARNVRDGQYRLRR
jgi:hypothetical protein